MDRGAWRATDHGVAKSQTRLSDEAHQTAFQGTCYASIAWVRTSRLREVERLALGDTSGKRWGGELSPGQCHTSCSPAVQKRA